MIWSDIAKDWEKIPLQTYQFIFSQAQNQFDETISESISITEKSIGLCKITVAAMSAFVGYNFKHSPGMNWIIFLGFLFIANLVLVAILMFPKEVKTKGSPPKEIFCNYLDRDDFTQDEKVVIVYYHELLRYQGNIEFMEKKNHNRQIYYGVALILTVLSTVLTAGVILSTIF